MLIGISGKMGSGKNEVADMISFLLFKNPNGTFNQFREAQDIRNNFLDSNDIVKAQLTLPNIHSFADNLKKCVGICCGINFNELNKQNVKSSKIPWMNISYRQLLQRFGQGIRTAIDNYFWSESLLQNYKDSDFWIISDLRYIEEAESILNRGGYLIRINRKQNSYDNHISETNLDNYDNFNAILDNDGSLAELFEKVKNLLIRAKILLEIK